MLVIDPDECIDCGACVDECPVHAIYPEEDLPEKWSNYLELNKELAAEWPVINETGDALPTAEEYKDKENKLADLDRSAAG